MGVANGPSSAARPRYAGPAAYLAPHPTWSSRTAILYLARQFPAEPEGPVADFLDQIHHGLAALASRPVFIAWAEKDLVFTRATLDRWSKDFPHAELLRLPEAGHFLQEDSHERVVPALVDFLARCRNRL
jgi:pimeloyl-ACP methyl ester carboxylesterase